MRATPPTSKCSKSVNSFELSVIFPSNQSTSLSNADVKSKNEFAAAELDCNIVFLKIWKIENLVRNDRLRAAEACKFMKFVR